MTDDQAIITRMFENVRNTPRYSNTPEIRRLRNLIESERYATIFVEGLFEWLQAANRRTPLNPRVPRPAWTDKSAAKSGRL